MAAGLELRAFGADAADLDVDFSAAGRAGVVTAVLARCAPLAEADAWALPVGVRLHALVELCHAAGWRELNRVLVCPAPDCDEEVEIELALAALAGAVREAGVPGPVEGFRPRRPTGDDLRRWHDRPPTDAQMVAELGGPDDAPPELVAAVEAALAEAEPLIDVRVSSACPRCGAPLEVAFDVEQEAVSMLRRAQDDLLRDVGTLARAFHWSEAEIVALPAHRRRRYLAMAEG
jgi:hypothetical protein